MIRESGRNMPLAKLDRLPWLVLLFLGEIPPRLGEALGTKTAFLESDVT
jgi:hypothetical protein